MNAWNHLSALAAFWRLFDANPVLAALLYLLFWPVLELAFFFRVRRVYQHGF
jgi:hypothetical protein